ncbi:MAG: flagellar hook-associated protein FlgL [Mycobacteriales bacterium]
MSTAFRITQRTVSNTMLAGLQANMGRMQKLQEQLSSGKEVSRPSDSPVKTVEAMQFRSGIRRTEQYARNADDGLAVLGTTDAALTDSLNMTGRVRELTIQGLNDTLNPQAREAIAAEIDTLREGLLGMANTRYLDRPIFGGNTNSADAYDKAGTFLGDGGKVTRTVAPGVKVEANVNGPDVFGKDGEDSHLFTVLKKISDALRGQTPDMHADLSTGLKNLDVAVDRVITTLGQVGARFNRVETMRNAAEDQLLTLTNSLSEAEDIDLPKTIVELQMQEVAYKAALGATARVVQPSLLDFLR